MKGKVGRIRSRVLAREPGKCSPAPDGLVKDLCIEAASRYLMSQEGLTGPKEPAPGQAEVNSLPDSRCPGGRRRVQVLSFPYLSALPFQAKRMNAD